MYIERIRPWGVVSLVGLAALFGYAQIDSAAELGSRSAVAAVVDGAEAAGTDDDAPPLAGAPASTSRASTNVGASSAATGASVSVGAADAAAPAEADAARRRFPRPGAIRGLYLNAWAAGSSARVTNLLEIARRTEINSFVIDIKDASGYISHRTEVPLAHEIGSTNEVRIRDLAGLLERLEREGIYPIARIVIVRDPILAKFRPELAVNDTAGGVWFDSKSLEWINPHSRDVWDYHVAIAREVALLGFPEIQLDYVRFPDAPPEDLGRAVYPGAEPGRTKPETIRALLEHVRAELADLDVELTADVFGVTTSAARDVGIGQLWESFIDRVDAVLPMVYPSHYWQGSYGFQAPNAHPYEIVRRALADALRRSALVEGAGLTIPWLQDFTLGPPAYTAAEVRAQIQATYDAGIREWILWNPGSRYTEAALEPDGGFDAEPLIRLADRLVPVSERYAVLDSVAAAREAARAAGASTPPDAEGAAPAPEPDATPPVPDSVEPH